ncbi:MAG: ATP synthase F1 subunit gamma [Deltaproteobacteria bacterium]|nr:ATP synthase F1 subunit gamma [Deltaproteobacteria bacterium]
MATLKEVQTKIGAVKKTKQITKAMNMVATSRLRGAQVATNGFRPYAGKFAEVLGSLSGKAGDETSPLLEVREKVEKIHVVLCTSDRGLCGGFNAHLIARAAKFLKEKKGDEITFSFTNFGKKGLQWTRKNGLEIVNEHVGIVGTKFGFNIASISGAKLVEGFLNGVYDEVYVIYSEFVNMAKQISVLKQVLPIPPFETVEEAHDSEPGTPFLAEHICEPSTGQLLGDLLPKNIYVQLYSALLETSASEHAARMTAMDNATSACNDMIDNLTLAYNKARQSAITADLMDIVGGAEALKG